MPCGLGQFTSPKVIAKRHSNKTNKDFYASEQKPIISTCELRANFQSFDTCARTRFHTADKYTIKH
jgi:hypothetical protein